MLIQLLNPEQSKILIFGNRKNNNFILFVLSFFNIKKIENITDIIENIELIKFENTNSINKNKY